MKKSPVIVWFRNDLRIEDNPALNAAHTSGAPVIGLYIYDQGLAHSLGAASLWWLYHSLKSLSRDLEKAGTRLITRKGDSAAIVSEVVNATNASSVFWNRRYFAPHVEIDKKLKTDLKKSGLTVETFNGALLREPWEVETKTGSPYRVFTPFWRALRAMGPARTDVLPLMRTIPGPSTYPPSDKIEDWKLLPTKPNWASEISETWTPGEKAARERLNSFLDGPIDHYKDGRDHPDTECTSRLSPHLVFGEISPLRIWRKTHQRIDSGEISIDDGDKFLSEIAWREFSYSLLYYNPTLPEKPLQKKFASFPWQNNNADVKAWRRGLTGYPIVDAGMRQLWQTGWVHNRVRMVVASFLIKDLLVPWQEGEAWFWDTLVDADLANNSTSWQWVAGCGADASPYFRIFNPVTQGEKFDPTGDYVRQFVPELKKMPEKYIHAPWKAPENILELAEVTLGKTYPFPILDHGDARKRALAGYDKVKNE